MSTFSERLQAIIEDTELSVRAFENTIGVPNGTFQKILKNNTDTSTENVRKIFLAFSQYNIDWLITGRGKMIREPEPEPVGKKERIEKLEKEIQEAKQRLDFLLKNLEDLQ